MGADYKPGTVAVVTLNGEEFRAMRTGTPSNMGWEVVRPSSRYWVGDASEFGRVTDVRPLVVLDLDESQGKSWLADWLRNNSRDGWDADPLAPFSKDMRWLADQIEAQTKPPRIPEPGTWGIVKARLTSIPGGREWTAVRTPKDGWRVDDGGMFEWDELIDPVLIREGVE